MTETIQEYRAEAARAMTERELQENVRQLCKSINALYYHTHNSRHSPSGFPDCTILTSDARLIFAELKREGKDPTEMQNAWLCSLELVADEVVGNRMGVSWPLEVYVWRPSDWLNGSIEAILKGETT